MHTIYGIVMSAGVHHAAWRQRLRGFFAKPPGLVDPWNAGNETAEKKGRVKGAADFLERCVPALLPCEHGKKRSAEIGFFTKPAGSTGWFFCGPGRVRGTGTGPGRQGEAPVMYGKAALEEHPAAREGQYRGGVKGKSMTLPGWRGRVSKAGSAWLQACRPACRWRRKRYEEKNIGGG